MLPDMGNILRGFNTLLPDKMTFQTQGTATQNSRGVPIQGTWSNATGIPTQIPCIIETQFFRRTKDGEILSTEGLVEPNSYWVLLDHLYAVDARMRCIDQNAVTYQIKQVTRDDHGVGTLLKVQVVEG